MSSHVYLFSSSATQSATTAPQLDATLASALSSPLHESISSLSEMTELDGMLDAHPSWPALYYARLEDVLDRAFSTHDPEALEAVHKSLFCLYELHVADAAETRALNQFNPLLTQTRRRIEARWLHSESSRLQVAPTPVGAHALVLMLKNMWRAHVAAAHPLFDFLEQHATREQLTMFFRSDSALNIRFFDLLLYALLGSRPEVRRELTQNLWDESGRGNPASSHVNLFKRLLDATGIGQALDNHACEMDWHGFAGHNQFMLTALNRAHNFKLLGIMSMTELLDPTQYEKLVRGCRRAGLGQAGELEYYEEHVTIDVVHGDGWLSNVIVPIVERTPEAGGDILFGAAWRLAACDAYYSSLHARLLDLPATGRHSTLADRAA
jgi:pyrroloquinoline quinone (PQQ) biosynthesis protein C